MKPSNKKLEALMEENAILAGRVLASDGYFISLGNIPDELIDDIKIIKNSNGSIKMIKLKKVEEA